MYPIHFHRQQAQQEDRRVEGTCPHAPFSSVFSGEYGGLTDTVSCRGWDRNATTDTAISRVALSLLQMPSRDWQKRAQDRLVAGKFPFFMETPPYCE